MTTEQDYIRDLEIVINVSGSIPPSQQEVLMITTLALLETYQGT